MVGARQLQRIAEFVLLLGAIAALFVASQFTLFQLTQAIGFGIGVLGLKLLSGYNGQFSIGHSIFFAVGAYTTAILTSGGANYYLTLPLAAFAAFVLGAMIGWPALRIRGHHLAVVTLVFALAASQIARSSLLAPLTGGPNGIGFDQPSTPIVGLTIDQWWYLLVLIAALALIVAATLLVNSRFGRSMQASRDHFVAARSTGINTAFVNTMSFGTSAAFAGFGGGLLMGPLVMSDQTAST